MDPGEGKADNVVPSPDNADLWKILTRLDSIVAAVNSKSSFLLAYNTFVIGTIILKWPVLPPALSGNVRTLATIALLTLLAASFVSLVFTFRAAYPFLSSPRKPNEYHSILFFGHIHEHASPDDFLRHLTTDQASLSRDLAYQIHTIAEAASVKSSMMKTSIALILFVQIPLVGLVALLRVLAVFVATV